MPKYITDPANANYDFGQDFNYSVWTQGTIVTLTNVPWNNDYRDICQFPSATGQTLDQYIDSNEATNDVINNISYIKFNVPIRINVPFNKAFKYNYLRVQNPTQPIPGNDTLKSYYYFILDVKYVAPNTTELTIQLDIFQSFREQFTFGNSYIERGHIGIANENAFDNYGRDWLTVPEGIDTGSEYQVITHKFEEVMHNRLNGFNVFAVSSVDLDADPGTVEAPKLNSAKGSIIQNIPSGAGYYLWQSESQFSGFIFTYSEFPWITQGIIGIYLIPNITRYIPTFDWVQAVGDSPSVSAQLPSGDIPVLKYGLFTNWRENTDFSNYIPERYHGLKKFFTSPYMMIEITSWTGQPILLKPESWNDADATITERVSLVPPSQRVIFNPYKYNASDDTDTIINGDDDGGEYLDLAALISNFPTLPIINNGALNYLASNFAGIPYQRQSAGWSQTRALRGNEVSYDQTNKGIQASKDTNRLQNAGIAGQAANQNLLLGQNQAATGIGNVITSFAAAGTGVSKGSFGLAGPVNSVGQQVMGAITTGNQQAANTTSANISQTVARGANTLLNTQAGYVNDTNKSLADWAARGDYENSIAGINAQVNDASMIQPSVSGQMGGDTTNIIYGNSGVSIRWKMLDQANIRMVGEYWLRYGYAIHKFASIPASLMVMSKFTYWKLQETYISSATMPESFKQIIRGIFEKGVTVWADPSYIGTIDIADNVPLEGITL